MVPVLNIIISEISFPTNQPLKSLQLQNEWKTLLQHSKPGAVVVALVVVVAAAVEVVLAVDAEVVVLMLAVVAKLVLPLLWFLRLL